MKPRFNGKRLENARRFIIKIQLGSLKNIQKVRWRRRMHCPSALLFMLIICNWKTRIIMA